MIAGLYDIECNQGSDLEINFTILGPGHEIQRLHGIEVYLGAKKHWADTGPAMFLWSTTTGEITADPQSGIINLKVPASTTSTITSSGVYDMVFQDTAGNVVKVLEGNFVLIKEVTR